ncbi:MAG: 30S ribosomal protein S12 methylthiotransferase RimO [Lentisphaeria bacterium]
MISKSKRPVAVAMVSLGCAKNLVDSEVMAGTLATAGFLLTGEAGDADVLVINTCAFIADARNEALAEVASGVAWKKARPGRRLAVAGCLPQRERGPLHERFPEIDLFLGVDDVPRIAELLRVVPPAPVPAVAMALPHYLYDETTPRLLLTPAAFAYVKIAEGCDHHCRFCAIPAIRGRQRSRAVASVVCEVRNLLAQGVHEINLIAQDTTRYGADRTDGATLAGLLRELDALPGQFWLRVLYTHPKHFTDELLEVFAGARHLVPYLDMPLQHISDHVLRDMGRGIGEDATRALLARLRERLPKATFRTTFLVGYPGETEADFARLLAFVKETRFDRLGAFAYSPEAGTPAAAITDGVVPAAVAQARRDALLEAQQAIAREKNQALVGQELEVLLERPDAKHGWLAGRSAGDAPDVDNTVHVHGRKVLIRHGFCRVRITAAGPYDLEAVPVS